MPNTKLHIRQLFIDASGSMEFHREALLDTIAEYLGDYRRHVAKYPDAEHPFGISFFHTILQPFCRMITPDSIPELTAEDFRPNGDTALFDGLWQQIDDLESSIRDCHGEDRVEVDLYIITDGIDTASTKVRFADLRYRIESLVAGGHWRFHFDAADLDTIEVNALIGLRREMAETSDPGRLRNALVDFLTPGSPNDLPKPDNP